MTISESLLPEFDQEMASTRKILEAMPDQNYSWKPHEKSMPLGRLAGHVAEMPNWATHTLTLERLVLTAEFKPLNANNKAELLESFDSFLPQARAALVAAKDEDFAKIWELEYGGQIVISMPRIAVFRGVVMNHMIHHRGQLTVYLRLNSVPFPGLYGPSADDKIT